VLGVSADSVAKTKKFQEKYNLPFPLLADVDKKICQAFGVIQRQEHVRENFQSISRMTFVIGPDGKIKHIFDKVKAAGHAEEVLGVSEKRLKTQVRG